MSKILLATLGVSCLVTMLLLPVVAAPMQALAPTLST